MSNLETIEETCESQQVTFVIHPVIRQAITGYEESLYIGLRWLPRRRGGRALFPPLRNKGHERLVFSKRVSPGGHALLRIEPVTAESLVRIKASVGNVHYRA